MRTRCAGLLLCAVLVALGARAARAADEQQQPSEKSTHAARALDAQPQPSEKWTRWMAETAARHYALADSLDDPVLRRKAIEIDHFGDVFAPTLQYLEEWDPVLLEEVQTQIADTAAHELPHTLVGPVHTEMNHIASLKKHNQELYRAAVRERDLNRDSRDLVAAYKDANSNEEKSRMKMRLHEMIGELFDLREARRQLRVESLSRELENLREQLSERRKNRQLIVELRVREMLLRKVLSGEPWGFPGE